MIKRQFKPFFFTLLLCTTLSISCIYAYLYLICNSTFAADTFAEQQIPAGISIYYPQSDSTIAASSTFLVGSCPPGSALLVNGQNARVNANGFFAQVVPLKPGPNKFELSLVGIPNSQKLIQLKRELPPQLLPSQPLQFVKESAEPKEDMGLVVGDILGLAVRATPGSHVLAIVGNHKIVLAPVSLLKKNQVSNINHGLDTAYGLSFQRYPRNLLDFYCGFIKIGANDHWHEIRPQFVLTKNNHSLALNAPSRITILDEPKVVETRHKDTVVRLCPGQARTTPLGAGVRLFVDGWQGDSIRCLLTPTKHVWILKEDLSIEEHPSFPPVSPVRTINIQPENKGARLVIPLNQRLPYQIEQHLKPNRLVLKIFGATADTDWITESPTDSALLESVTWKQNEDKVYELTVHFKSSRQWGYWADYEDSNLILHIKGPPYLVPTNIGQPLSGLIVCVDPGHGKEEAGSIGPSGIKESQINLDIALSLKDKLEHLGAKVILTRTTENENPTLQERVATAINSSAPVTFSTQHCPARWQKSLD